MYICAHHWHIIYHIGTSMSSEVAKSGLQSKSWRKYCRYPKTASPWRSGWRIMKEHSLCYQEARAECFVDVSIFQRLICALIVLLCTHHTNIVLSLWSLPWRDLTSPIPFQHWQVLIRKSVLQTQAVYTCLYWLSKGSLPLFELPGINYHAPQGTSCAKPRIHKALADWQPLKSRSDPIIKIVVVGVQRSAELEPARSGKTTQKCKVVDGKPPKYFLKVAKLK